MGVMGINNKLYFIAKKGSKAIRRFVPQELRIAIKETMVQKGINSYLPSKQNFDPEAFPKGVNLIGSIYAEMGLGQSCRLVAKELQNSGVRFSIYNVNFDENLREADTSFTAYVSGELPYSVNIFHVNPCELGKVFMRMPEAWNRHYNIAFWLWELEEFPDEWVKYCQLFDEIWTPSEFAGRGVRARTGIPVKTMPYSVVAPCRKNCTRKDFGLPEKMFLFLVMYDCNSTTGRKNPQGAVEAYKRAFPAEETDCGLVIKLNNASKKNIQALKKHLTDYKNVYFITETLEKSKVNSLIKAVDVYISLHRSEGFGLVMAEAMLLGVPVIATDWSANTEFMNKESSCMVRYKLVKNKRREGLYKKGCEWAEPDTDEAAEYIRRLKDDPEYYRRKAENGTRHIGTVLGERKTADLWRKSIDSILH